MNPGDGHQGPRPAAAALHDCPIELLPAARSSSPAQPGLPSNPARYVSVPSIAPPSRRTSSQPRFLRSHCLRKQRTGATEHDLVKSTTPRVRLVESRSRETGRTRRRDLGGTTIGHEGRATMKHRRMGRTGLKVSEICLGTMTFAGQSDEDASFRILDVAAERGVTFLDTADAYPIPPDPEKRRPYRRGHRPLAGGLRRGGEISSSSPPSAGSGSGTGLTTRDSHAAIFWRPARPACAGCELMRSTCTRPISPTPTLQSTKRCAPSTIWSARARSAMPAARTTRPGSSRLRCNPASDTAGPGSTASSRAITCSTARSRASFYRSAATRALALSCTIHSPAAS